MPSDLDADGQPDPRLGYSRRVVRSLDELLGICKGIMSDGRLVDAEVVALHEWLESNDEIGNQWPATILGRRVRDILRDGYIDAGERIELVGILEDVIGGETEITMSVNRATTLPIDEPQPAVFFEDRVFCFTGRFFFGSRPHCEKMVMDRAGRVTTSVSRKLHYLVIGHLGSRDWLHSTFGTKIQSAVELKDGGHPLAIISEDHWSTALDA